MEVLVGYTLATVISHRVRLACGHLVHDALDELPWF